MLVRSGRSRFHVYPASGGFLNLDDRQSGSRIYPAAGNDETSD